MDQHKEKNCDSCDKGASEMAVGMRCGFEQQNVGDGAVDCELTSCHTEPTTENVLSPDATCPPIIDHAENHKDRRRRLARDVAKGMFVGTCTSLLFVTILLILVPESTVRWMESKYWMRKPSFPNVIPAFRETGEETSFFRLGNVHRQLKKISQMMSIYQLDTHYDDRELESEPPLGENERQGQPLDRTLVKAFFSRTNSPRVYHAGGTLDETSSGQENSQNESSKKLPRHLQGLDEEEGESGMMYDSSSKNPSDAKENMPPKDPQLVVAGKMTVEDGACNIAQLNLKTGEWSLQQRIQLSLYNSYSGGEVYSLLANHTIVTNSNQKEFGAEVTSSKHSR